MRIIQRDDNVGIANFILGLSAEITKNISKESDIIDSNIVNLVKGNLGQIILENYYKEVQLELSKTLNLKDAPLSISPKTNSVLSLLNHNAQTSSMGNMGLSIVNNKTRDMMVDKITNEVTFYKHNVLKRIKRYAYKVDAFIKGNNSEVVGTDLFSINILKPLDILDIMESKGYLNEVLVLNQDPQTDVKSLTISAAYNSELSDLELNMLRDDALNSMSPDSIQDIIMFFNKLNEVTILEHTLFKTSLLDINAVIMVVLYYRNLYNTNNDDLTGAILNKYVSILNTFITRYNDQVKTKEITIASSEENGIRTIYVNSDTYNELTTDGGNFKMIAGSVMTENLSSSLTYFSKTKDDILANKIFYTNIYNKHIETINLEERNKQLHNLRSFYNFALTVTDTEDKVNDNLEAVETYVKTLNISDLLNTKATALNIFKNVIYKDSNFSLFMDFFDEADDISKDPMDVKLATGYAAYKMSIYYLATQTTLINK